MAWLRGTLSHWLWWPFMALTGCGAADVDESLWETNEVGGGDAFANLGQQQPTGTGPQPTATGPVPTGTATGPLPTSTATGPIPTSTGPVPTSTGTGPVPTSTGTTPIPTSTSTGTVPTGTTPVPTGTTDPIPTGNSGPCAVTLNFTTVTVNGRYAPRHVEAAWVETQSGQFIQTLEAYGTIRIGNLVTWNAKALGSTVDAVTGATIPLHRAHTVTWDCIDLQNAPVLDGTYRFVVEFTEDNSGGFLGAPTQQLTAEFLKSTDPLDFTLPDTTAFRGIHLIYQ